MAEAAPACLSLVAQARVSVCLYTPDQEASRSQLLLSSNTNNCCSLKIAADRFYRTGSASGLPHARLCCQKKSLITLPRTGSPFPLAARVGECLAWLRLPSCRSSAKLTPPPPGLLIHGGVGASTMLLISSVTCSSHLPSKFWFLPGDWGKPGLRSSCLDTISAHVSSQAW